MNSTNGKKPEYSAWWREEQPHKELPEHLQALLKQNDPAFIDELKKFAYQSFNNYKYQETRWGGYFTWVRNKTKNGSWLWTLYLNPHPLARQAFHELFTHYTYGEFVPFTKVEVPKKGLVSGPSHDFYSYRTYSYTLIPFTDVYFRYIKAIYKLAEWKRDYKTWAVLAHRFDTLYGQGYFSNKTRHYLRRRTWRTLRNTGRERPSDYIRMSMDVLMQLDESYGTEFNRKYWLFNHILYHNSTRYRYRSDGWTIVNTDDQVAANPLLGDREEAFPDLWDTYPEQLWKLVQEARSGQVILFAGKALRKGNFSFVKNIEDSSLKTLFKDQHPVRRMVAAAMICDRLDPKQTDLDTWFDLAISQFPEVREQAYHFLKTNMIHWSEEQLGSIVQRFVSKLQTDDLAEAIVADWVQLFHHKLKPVLNRIATLQLVQKLMSVSIPAIQELGLLLVTQMDLAKYPLDANSLLPILSEIESPLCQMARQILSERFTQLQITPSFLVELASIPGEDHQVFTTQFFTDRLLWLVPFHAELIPELWKRMLRNDLPEEVCDYIREDLLGSLFWSELEATPLSKVLLLIDSDSTALQEFGARLIQLIQPEASQLTFEQLLNMAHCPVALVREEARGLILQIRKDLTDDGMVNLVETDWADTREWMFSYIKTLSRDEFTTDLIYGLLDTARDDIQQFAMEMVEIHRKELDMKELMLRASESPYPHIHEYALQLADEVSWDAELVKRLELFFRTVLFRVNAGRKAKKKALDLLMSLGQQSEELAECVVPLLADVARNETKKELERILLVLTRIQTQYPNLSSPLQLIN
ncbi:hypothetical protein EDD58_103303 [Hazenella coriacea]|uniref:Uncharacterized protein n=2 Tax=Hazenella coriacea TaxID=1179467 RepID=A0A4R3L7F3_9BACL|nr:hypothetical protein EDD58_103303 [Hazenella coriacea]